MKLLKMPNYWLTTSPSILFKISDLNCAFKIICCNWPNTVFPVLWNWEEDIKKYDGKRVIYWSTTMLLQSRLCFKSEKRTRQLEITTTPEWWVNLSCWSWSFMHLIKKAILSLKHAWIYPWYSKTRLPLLRGDRAGIPPLFKSPCIIN